MKKLIIKNLTQSWADDMNKYLSKTFKMAKKYMKNVEHDLLIIREMHLRTIMIYCLTPVRMAKVKPQKGNAQQNVEKREHFCPCWWEYKLV